MSFAGGDEPFTNGILHNLRSIVQTQFLHKVGAMALDGFGAQRELFTYLSGGSSLCCHTQDFTLSACEAAVAFILFPRLNAAQIIV